MTKNRSILYVVYALELWPLLAFWTTPASLEGGATQLQAADGMSARKRFWTTPARPPNRLAGAIQQSHPDTNGFSEPDHLPHVSRSGHLAEDLDALDSYLWASFDTFKGTLRLKFQCRSYSVFQIHLIFAVMDEHHSPSSAARPRASASTRTRRPGSRNLKTDEWVSLYQHSILRTMERKENVFIIHGEKYREKDVRRRMRRAISSDKALLNGIYVLPLVPPQVSLS